jgi:hypothetical protein
MRLPTDATLLLGPGADPELERVWREERLPTLTLPCREADLEGLSTATIVACGEGGRDAAALAAGLGFRTFLVGDGPAPDGVRLVTLAEALTGARSARARERWKAARGSA